MDVARATEDLKDNVTKGIERAQERVEEKVAQTKDMIVTLNEQVEALVRQSPLVALGGAFAVGYLIAKLARVRVRA
jgi:ElaB/YqjD/DUF883 family membrane-anchored ribosome-binding protein